MDYGFSKLFMAVFAFLRFCVCVLMLFRVFSFFFFFFLMYVSVDELKKLSEAKVRSEEALKSELIAVNEAKKLSEEESGV